MWWADSLIMIKDLIVSCILITLSPKHIFWQKLFRKKTNMEDHAVQQEKRRKKVKAFRAVQRSERWAKKFSDEDRVSAESLEWKIWRSSVTEYSFPGEVLTAGMMWMWKLTEQGIFMIFKTKLGTITGMEVRHELDSNPKHYNNVNTHSHIHTHAHPHSWCCTTHRDGLAFPYFERKIIFHLSCKTADKNASLMFWAWLTPCCLPQNLLL